jgi:hypothetical protein
MRARSVEVEATGTAGAGESLRFFDLGAEVVEVEAAGTGIARGEVLRFFDFGAAVEVDAMGCAGAGEESPEHETESARERLRFLSDLGAGAGVGLVVDLGTGAGLATAGFWRAGAGMGFEVEGTTTGASGATLILREEQTR